VNKKVPGNREPIFFPKFPSTKEEKEEEEMLGLIKGPIL
jgi:hypothetical protein